MMPNCVSMYRCPKKVVVGGGKPTLRRQQVRRIYFMLNLVLKEPSIALVRIFNQIEKGPEDNAFCTFTIFSISLFFQATSCSQQPSCSEVKF